MKARSLILILALWNFKTVLCKIDPVIIIHGGAGTISNTSAQGMLRGVSIAATIGYEILMQTDNAMEAVEEAGLWINWNHLKIELFFYFSKIYGAG